MNKFNSIKIYISALISLVLSSCGTEKYSVVPINKLGYNQESMVYTLPKTALTITVEVNKKSMHKAPFAAYAQQFLGITEAIQSDKAEFEITKISFMNYPIADTAQTYAIFAKGNTTAQLINVTSAGFLAGINLTNFTNLYEKKNETEFTNNNEQNFNLSFSDYRLQPQLETQYDTLYKEVFQDSMYVKVPVVRKQMVNKSSEKQAQELADQIFMLRDDRNALMKGENDGDNSPTGDALKIMVQYLNKLEKEYMSLFTGKVTNNKLTFSFYFIPDENSLKKKQVLFKFSKNYGIQNKNSNYGKVVEIQTITLNNLSKIKSYKQNANLINAQKKKQTGIYYRVPEIAEFNIWYNNKILTKETFTIPQFGETLQLPSKAINKSSEIEFYPNTGAIKRISSK